ERGLVAMAQTKTFAALAGKVPATPRPMPVGPAVINPRCGMISNAIRPQRLNADNRFHADYAHTTSTIGPTNRLIFTSCDSASLGYCAPRRLGPGGGCFATVF